MALLIWKYVLVDDRKLVLGSPKLSLIEEE